MATTISKINVYKNNEWESYPISTTAQNVVTSDGNLTNTISSLKNDIKNLTDTIIPGLSTNIESKLPIAGGGINGNLTISGNLDVVNDITVNGQLTTVGDITTNGNLYTEHLRIFDTNNGTSQNNYLDLSMTNAQATIMATGTYGEETTTPNYLRLTSGFVNGRAFSGVQVSHPTTWRAALGIATVSKQSIAVSEYNGTIELVKYADGLVTCDVVLPDFPSATTTSAKDLIPSGYRPKESKYNIWGAGMDRNNALRGFGLTSDGSIKGYYSANTGLWFHVVYYA